MAHINQIFNIIEDYAATHNQINTTIFGAASEIDNSDVDGVLLWYDVSGGTVDNTMFNYTFDLYFLDILNPDNSNLKDVLNDTHLIALDMAALIDGYSGTIEFDLPQNLTINPVEHKYTSDYAGHSLTFTIQAPTQWDTCQVPTRTTPTPTPQPVFTVYDNNDVSVGTVTGDELQVIAKDTLNNILTATYTLANGVLTLSGISTSTTVSKMIIIDNVTTIAQDAELIGSYTLANLCIFGNGTEQISVDNISAYNATTGTITFITSLDGVTIRVILIA
jgi:hypothetical protein